MFRGPFTLWIQFENFQENTVLCLLEFIDRTSEMEQVVLIWRQNGLTILDPVIAFSGFTTVTDYIVVQRD